MTVLHEAQAKAKRPQEPALGAAKKMMQRDADDPLFQPTRPKPDPNSTSISNNSKRTLRKDPRPLDSVKHGMPKPPPVSQPAKPGVKPKTLALARQGVQKPHK